MKHDTGVLLMHGFSGDLDEVRPLRAALEARGYDVETPVLSGHGGTRAELARSSYGDWLDSARGAHGALARRNGRVAAIGFSMGGLIAFALNAETPLAGIMTVNTPVYYWHKRRIAYNLAHDFRRAAPDYCRRVFKAPPRALINFTALLKHAKPLIEQAHCPLLVMQALDDDTVQPRSVRYITEHARGPKDVMMLERGGHQVLQNGDIEDIARRADAFIVSLDH